MRIVMSVFFMLLLLSFPAAGRSAGTATVDSGDTPSAADLFRAKRRAEEARQRLEIPRGEAGGWKRGGTGWGTGTSGTEPRRRESRPAGGS